MLSQLRTKTPARQQPSLEAELSVLKIRSSNTTVLELSASLDSQSVLSESSTVPAVTALQVLSVTSSWMISRLLMVISLLVSTETLAILVSFSRYTISRVFLTNLLATITNSKLTNVKSVCTNFEGVAKGNEPTEVSEGADGTTCIFGSDVVSS